MQRLFLVQSYYLKHRTCFNMTDKEWHISRKNFIRTVVLGGIALQLPWLQACSANEEEWGDLSPLNKKQFKTIRAVQMILFPDDGDGPGALEFKADFYLLWVLNDLLLDPDENRYIIEKADQFRVTCKDRFDSEFYELSSGEQHTFVEEMTQESWGERWLSRLLTLIFEALLLDPVYGGNTNEAGWKWLGHNPGTPRPPKELIYPLILERKNEV